MTKNRNEKGETVYTFPLSTEDGWELARDLGLFNIRCDLHLTEKAIAEIKKRPKDPRNQDFPKIEALISRIRRQLQKGNDALAMASLLDLERERRLSHFRVLKPTLELGQKFARRGRGINSMTKLIDQALRALGVNASARDVHRHVVEIAPRGTIEHVDGDGSLEWREGNTPRTLTFHSFQKRVSQRRKKISSQ